MKNTKKKYLVGFLAILLTLLLFFNFFKKKAKNNSNINKSEIIKDTIIPTVDNSVVVEMKLLRKGEISLIIKNEPQGTQSIDFELSYYVKNQDVTEEEENNSVQQGAIGACYKSNNLWQCGEEDKISGGRKIVLGTCSSGVCRYHEIIGKIKLNLKFSGNYGEKILEKQYSI